MAKSPYWPDEKFPLQIRRAASHLAPVALLLGILTGCGGARETEPENGASTRPQGEQAESATVHHQDKAPEKEPPTEPNQVVIDNFRFSPRTLTVPAGTKVTWINRDDVPHTATSTARPRAFDSKTLDTDDSFAHVFASPGTYDYFCAVHPHMTGTILVK
jgi:plastocyanin